MSKVLLNLEDLSQVNGGIFYDFVGGINASGIVLSRENDSIFIKVQEYNILDHIAASFNLHENLKSAFIVNFFIGSLRSPNSVVKFFGEYADIDEYMMLKNPLKIKFVNNKVGKI